MGEKTLEKSLILYTPFSKKLFQNPFSQKIIKEALSTTFITGMAQGKLPLSNYRNFLEQDAAYFEHVADVYRLAAIKMEIQKKKIMLIFIGNSPQNFSIFTSNSSRKKIYQGKARWVQHSKRTWIS